jgi:hypothetical protein
VHCGQVSLHERGQGLHLAHHSGRRLATLDVQASLDESRNKKAVREGVLSTRRQVDVIPEKVVGGLLAGRDDLGIGVPHLGGGKTECHVGTGGVGGWVRCTHARTHTHTHTQSCNTLTVEFVRRQGSVTWIWPHFLANVGCSMSWDKKSLGETKRILRGLVEFCEFA